MDQNYGPHVNGCPDCTGLVTVHNGDARSGQLDYTIEYYDMGHLTKFVRPGATRIGSTPTTGVSNVAWQNPDGTIALIAYNGNASAQTVRVNSGGRSFVYTLPGNTTATFTWPGPTPTSITVPNVVGSTQAQATKAIDAAGLSTGTVSPDNQCIEAAGVVVGQDPATGTYLLLPGSRVNLTVSSGQDARGRTCVPK